MPQCYKAFLQFFQEFKSSYETDLGQDLVLFSFYLEWFGKGIIRVHTSLQRLVPFSRTGEFIITNNLKSIIHKWSQQYPGV